MKKVSNINEFWGAVIRRDMSSAVREEDKNIWDRWIDTVEWVDMGNGILISDKCVPGLEDVSGNEFIDLIESEDFKKVLDMNDADIIDDKSAEKMVNFISIVDKNGLRYLKSDITGNTIEHINGTKMVCKPFVISNDGNRKLCKLISITGETLSISRHYYNIVKGYSVVVRLIKRIKK